MTTDTQRTVVNAWGLFTALLFLMLGRGLFGVLVGVRSELEGFSTLTTGVIVASYFAGFLAGSQIAPRMMARVGHIRVFSGLASLVAVSALVHALWISPVPWTMFGLLFGFGMAGLYVVTESWLNEAAPDETRGRVMAVYMVVAMGGAALGQVLLVAGDPVGTSLFLVTGALIAVAVVPVSLSIGSAPTFELPPESHPREVWKAAPLGIVGALFGGLANAAILGMAAVYAIQVGLTTGRAAVFVAAASAGAVLLQWPIGHLSDVIGRRRTILIFSVAATLVAVGAVGLDPGSWLAVGAMLLFGGFSLSMYSLSLSHVIDVLPRGSAVVASMAVVFVTGVGSVFGPIVVSLAINLVGPDGLWWTVAAAHVVIALFAVSLWRRRSPIKETELERYLAIPARSTGIAGFVFRKAQRGDEG